MANVVSMAILTLCLAIGLPAHARDTRHVLSIAVAMETKDAQDKLDGSVRFYFGDQSAPQVLAMLGSATPAMIPPAWHSNSVALDITFLL